MICPQCRRSADGGALSDVTCRASQSCVLLSFLAATVLFPYVVITVPSGMVGVLMEEIQWL